MMQFQDSPKSNFYPERDLHFGAPSVYIPSRKGEIPSPIIFIERDSGGPDAEQFYS